MSDKFVEHLKKIKLMTKSQSVVVDLNNLHDNNEVLNNVAKMLDNGILFVQLVPDKNSDVRTLDVSNKILQLSALYNFTFIIKQRADIAFILEADGILLDENSMDIHSAKEILGKNTIIGFSSNNSEIIEKAIKNGADYINIELINSTPTSSIVKSVGLEYAKWVSENLCAHIYICDKTNQTTYQTYSKCE